MKSQGALLGVSGVFFGVLVGWILGSQQAAPPAVVSGSPAPAGGSTSTSSAPPLDLQRASDLERQANARPADANVRVQLGDLYFDAQRFDLAIPWYQAALKIDNRNVNASTDLAVSLFSTNEVDRALKQIDHSLSVDPRHAKTLLNQGIIRAWGKQDLEGAAAAWEQVVKVAPTSPEGTQAKQFLDGLKSAHKGVGGKRP